MRNRFWVELSGGRTAIKLDESDRVERPAEVSDGDCVRHLSGCRVSCVEEQMRSPMLGAKLFFLSGLVLLVAGLLLRPAGLPMIDIYGHETYFVVAHFHLVHLATLALWTYAGLYYLGARLFGLQFSSTLTILHVLITTVALIGLNSFRYVGIYGTAQRPVSPLLVRVTTLGGALFLIGIIMFIVILILATVARVRRAHA